MQRKFVPAGLDVSVFGKVEPLFLALEGREVLTGEALERWVVDCSELGAVLSEEGARRYINMTCHTDDAAAEKAYVQWVEEIVPRCKPHWQKLDEKFLAAAGRSQLDAERYRVLIGTRRMMWRCSARRIFRCRRRRRSSISSTTRFAGG
jgi:oligoendopeptidase F